MDISEWERQIDQQLAEIRHQGERLSHAASSRDAVASTRLTTVLLDCRRGRGDAGSVAGPAAEARSRPRRLSRCWANERWGVAQMTPPTVPIIVCRGGEYHSAGEVFAQITTDATTTHGALMTVLTTYASMVGSDSVGRAWAASYTL
jgi:hypothetical protein